MVSSTNGEDGSTYKQSEDREPPKKSFCSPKNNRQGKPEVGAETLNPSSESPVSIQRVSAAIQRRPVDRIPKGEITIEDEVVRDALGCAEVGFEERLRFTSLLGLDIYCLSPRWDTPPSVLPNARDFAWPDLRSWVDRSGLFVFAVLDGAFGWGVKLFGFMKFLTLSVNGEETLRDFHRGIESLNGELARGLADQGVHGFILADDIAYQSGLYVGPKAMRRQFLPSIAHQAEEMLSLGLPVILHSDGNYLDILPEISAIGFHGLHCIDPESGMVLEELRPRVGSALCLWGTLSARELERCLAPEGRADALKKIGDAAAAGSFMVGTTSGLFKGLKIEALRALYEKI